MKFKFLSVKKRRQRTARNFGAMLLLIGILIRNSHGAIDLKYLGILLLVWSGLSWLARRSQETSGKELATAIHLIALIVFIIMALILMGYMVG